MTEVTVEFVVMMDAIDAQTHTHTYGDGLDDNDRISI
jgi:hypothetical protein